MPYGIYLSAEGAQAQSRRMEILAHNLANVDTPGFQRQLAVLQARHAEAIERGSDYPGSRSGNDVGGGVYVPEVATQYGGGALRHTGIPTDMAIDGEGFFIVEEEGKTYLTRAGNFMLTNTGRLVTPGGLPVLSESGGPIELDPALPWRVTESGAIHQAGASTALALVKPASLGDLVRRGHNLFEPLADTAPVPEAERHVRGGYLEHANVQPTLEMMELIEASRAFEANVRLIQNQDHMIGTLVNRVLRAE
jgi:flagellar basal-body rod protein FlgF/flagellar basal-body rod protein FlgG